MEAFKIAMQLFKIIKVICVGKMEINPVAMFGKAIQSYSPQSK